MKRLLTKSRFKLALDCPVKLYYTGKKEYPDMKIDDPFLESLAEGGFQVGELAKLYYPEGINIGTLDHADALAETNKFLQQENATIFEAAVQYKNFFIRIDILEKKGNRFNLIEVKSKSANHDIPAAFFKKDGSINGTWKPYLFDTAFQKYVLEQAFPNNTVTANLMLADKDKKTSIDGLNQRFFLEKDKYGRTRVRVTNREDTGEKILRRVSVEDACQTIYNDRYEIEDKELSFEEYLDYLAESYVSDRKINHPIGAYCGKCEFNPDSENLSDGFKSGFRECWREKAGFEDKDFDEPMVFELWNYKKKQSMIDCGIYHIKNLDAQLFEDTKSDSKPGLTTKERQLIQFEKVRDHSNTPYIDKEGIRREIDTWKFPLHFIDFETSMVAIPFHKNRSPYEAIAFQFSHHIVDEKGNIEHKGQYLNDHKGEFPNYHFVQALRKELESDTGSIFRYASHENSILSAIYCQLIEDKDDIPDKTELLEFIESITHSTANAAKKWMGPRDMIDLLALVKSYYYHPQTKGSNSIKAILPTVLESEFIREKYSQPIYGDPEHIKSLNYSFWKWLQTDENGIIISPYHLLPNLFEGIDQNQLDEFITDKEEIAEGGAAMTAYARMQFTEMKDFERQLLSKSLLKYCELDTMAMVMIYEYFKNL